MAGVIGLLDCVAFTGVAMTPENRLMAVHIEATFTALTVRTVEV